MDKVQINKIKKRADEYATSCFPYEKQFLEREAVVKCCVHVVTETIAELEKENAESKCECRTCVYTDSPCVRSDYPSKGGVCSHYKNVFEENAELTERNKHLYNDLTMTEAENAELRKVAEFQQSSNMSRHFENKKLKEGLVVGSTFNKALNSMNKNLEEERDKYRNMVFDKNGQLTKAKELLTRFVMASVYFNGKETDLVEEAEQFLNSKVQRSEPPFNHQAQTYVGE